MLTFVKTILIILFTIGAVAVIAPRTSAFRNPVKEDVFNELLLCYEKNDNLERRMETTTENMINLLSNMVGTFQAACLKLDGTEAMDNR